MKKLACALVFALVLSTGAFAVEKVPEDAISIAVPSAVLIEKTTGEVIYEKNAHERMLPASVTKVMTMLLVMEAIDAGTITLDTMISCSGYAASMGGSQIWLEEGEQMSVHEMLKCIAVVSANDCCVALAEHLAGTEEAFVARMNEKAAELGMTNTVFRDCTGLHDDPEHLTTAYDIALMSRELLKHELIRDYTTIWMDSVRDGVFGLSNTNKLIYYYEGATGLKTGFTSKAMYCLSASAMRDGVEYIAVVMHGATSNERFDSAKTLLNYAFANYTLARLRPDEELPQVAVELGKEETIRPIVEGPEALLLEKAGLSSLTKELEIAESVQAPVAAGQRLGTLTIKNEAGDIVASAPVVAAESVPRLTRWEIFLSFFDLFT